MEIIRINTYTDSRFSQRVLNQHGCFEIDNMPYEVEIISECEAVIRGINDGYYPELIEEFRFYTPHITVFYNDDHVLITELPKMEIIAIAIDDIQPSQFFIDQNKVNAIGDFINCADDIIIQVIPYNDGYISLDGHTRLYYAITKGWKHVRAVTETAEDWVYKFVDEARKRNVYSPKDLVLLTHENYEERWIRFCDDFFNKEQQRAL